MGNLDLATEHFEDALDLCRKASYRQRSRADITVFDPQHIGEQATYDDPHQYASGVTTVLVNGTVVIDRGNHTEELPGREVLAPLLPRRVNTHPSGGGRPRVPDRTCANGIFYVLRTGCQWKALDSTGICSGSTAHLRFQEWVAAGVFLQLWQVGLERYDELKGLDWSWLSMDGAMTKAPLGGGKNRSQPHGPR